MNSAAAPKGTAERVAILVDVANVYAVAKNQHNGAKVDLVRLKKMIAGERDVVSATAYFCTPPGVDISRVRETLEREGYAIKEKKASFQKSTATMVMDWTAGICIDADRAARTAETIVLVTGRDTFTDLVKALRGGGANVEVVSFESSCSESLRGEASAFTPITEDLLRPAAGNNHNGKK